MHSDQASSNEIKRRAAWGALASVIAQVIRFATRLSSQVVLARLLLPSDYGLIAMVAPIFGLFQLLADLGIGQAIVQSKTISYAQLNSLFWLTTFANSCIACLLILIAPLIAFIFKQHELLQIVILLGSVIPVAGLAVIPNAILNRRLQFVKLSIVDTSAPIFGLLVGVLAAKYGLGLYSLIASAGCESLCYVIMLFIASRWMPGRPGYDSAASPLLLVGGHLTGYNLAQFLTTTVDNIAVALTNGPAALGLYDKSYRVVSQPISQLLSPVHQIAIPLLSRQFAQDYAEYSRTFLGILKFIMLLLTPALIALLTLSFPIVTVVLGARWREASPIISWFCLGALASCIYTSTSWLFISQGRSKEQLYYGTATSIISMTGFMAGLPWGPIGVSAGAGISFFFISTPYACYGVTRRGPITTCQLLEVIVPLIAASCVAVSIVAVSGTAFRHDSIAFSRLSAIVVCELTSFFATLFCFEAYYLPLASAGKYLATIGADFLERHRL